jgi:hypothetical protein
MATRKSATSRNDVPLKEYDRALIARVSETLGEDSAISTRVISAAIQGRETTNEHSAIEHWIEGQLIPNSLLIGKDGYTEMCIDALKTISVQVLTDFGTSRQRDFGQAWSDTIRGYLGEYAVTRFLEREFGIRTRLAHQRGIAKTFYDSDIAEVLELDSWRKPKMNIGIKTTKFNGLWLDVAKEQFSKSDIHIQVKIGGGSTHLFSFFKELSVFRDKILKVGLDGNFLTQEEAEQILDDIPKFKDIPAYITGFAIRDFPYKTLDYEGHMAKLHYTIHTFRGALPRDYREQIAKQEGVSSRGKVKFESIEEFSKSDRFLFNSGSITRTKSEWAEIVARL